MRKQEFVKRSRIHEPAETVFGWHMRPGALERLTPPWERVELVAKSGSPAEKGSRVTLRTRIGPVARLWVAEHTDVVPNRSFRDVQVSGPFAHWEHTHTIEPAGERACVLEDRVEYLLPGGRLGNALGAAFVREKLERMFAYRHRTTAADVASHRALAQAQEVFVTGSRGLIGSSLVPFLTTGGHRVHPVRREGGHRLDLGPLKDADAVVHLAGEGIASRRWSRRQKARIRESRVEGTKQLVKHLLGLDRPPRVLVAASAIGFYGDRGDEVVDETSAPGAGFLADVCRAWEAAAAPAREAGIRVVCLRFGTVLSPKGGALAKMLPVFRLGGGGRIGHGRQFLSWIGIDDAVGAIHHAIADEALEGPVNAVAPAPVTNREFTRTLAATLSRPAILPLPSFAARLVFGEMADELLLSSTRVEPRRLLERGYAFRDPDLAVALRRLLGRTG